MIRCKETQFRPVFHQKRTELTLPLELTARLFPGVYRLSIFKTKGIVLRTVKFGETSVIVSILTEAFGMQSYLINGVRTSSPKIQNKSNLFQPGAILQLSVYHNELKNLQRIRESGWSYMYDHVFFNVAKNAVAMFIVELLAKCLKQPEQNEELFQFVESALIRLDASSDQEMANYPLFFAANLAAFLGIRIQDNYAEDNRFLDLQEGRFVQSRPGHLYFIGEPFSELFSKVLKITSADELGGLKMNRDTRRVLIGTFQNYYALHVPDFGTLKSLPVLQTVISG
ncbi:MAG TPA: DNA repair protein RecO [Puia sp.]|nr:DNA repair protein RecO [Puia sp.]